MARSRLHRRFVPEEAVSGTGAARNDVEEEGPVLLRQLHAWLLFDAQ
ncbi:hypothetical protein ACFW9O_33840 [Streptomyces sp. NPDC059499]